MSDQLDYVYQRGAVRVLHHVRRYPRHYGALALWAAAMVLVPVIATGATSPTAPASAASGVGAAPVRTGAAPVAISAPLATTLGAMGASTDVAADVVASFGSAAAVGEDVPTPTPSPAPQDPEPTGGAGPGVTLPPPPPVPLPQVPAELQPVLAAVAPLTSQGCSAVGLAAVVAAVVGPTAGDTVPFAQLLPYLAPAYSACATFPGPGGPRTLCALDEQMRGAGYPADVSGLAKTPNVIGVGVDVLFGLEDAVAAYTGQTLGIAQQIADQLGCHPDPG